MKHTIKNYPKSNTKTSTSPTINLENNGNSQSLNNSPLASDNLTKQTRLPSQRHLYRTSINGKKQSTTTTKNQPANNDLMPIEGFNNKAQAFLSRGAEVIIRMRGLPYDCTTQQVIDFFSKSEEKVKACSIMHGSEGVLFVRKFDGKATGDAFVLFESENQAAKALLKQRQCIGSRYIELFRSTTAEVQQVLNRSMDSTKMFSSSNHHGSQLNYSNGSNIHVNNGHQIVVENSTNVNYMIHTNSTSDNTIDDMSKSNGARQNSIATTDSSSQYTDGESDRSPTRSTSNGSPSSQKDPLLPSTQASPENQSIQNRSPSFQLQPPPFMTAIPGHQHPFALMSQSHVMPSSSRKDCVRMRGLPYEAQVEQILEFLGEYGENIVYQGVHMVYNAQGQPSGEAFIQMDSEQSAQLAAQYKHHKNMTSGKKLRYIEVFQCSVDDMNLVLTNGVPIHRPIIPVSGLMPHHHYGPYPHPFIQPGQTAMLPALTASSAAAAALARVVPHGHPQAHPCGPGPMPTAYYHPILYWPSPPVSPTSYYHASNINHAMVNM